MKNKIIAIVGTTASGKTTLAVKLAKKFNGEVVSADSRQVYKYMDVGTGKDLREYILEIPITKTKKGLKIHIPYHMIDVVHPKTEYSLGKFYKRANRCIEEIAGRGRVPIVAGGTGLYTQALVDGYELSDVKPDRELRAGLEKLSIGVLYKKLEKLDKKFANKVHESDKKNKRRLVRYIEVRRLAARINPPRPRQTRTPLPGRGLDSEYLVIGLTWPREVLSKRIYKRLVARIEEEDMIGEVERLHSEHKVSWKRLMSFGLEYKFITMYLRHEISKDEMIEKLHIAIRQFSKRQMTWYRRWERQGRKIGWVKNYKEAENLVGKFLK